jgi:hypothetical protein
MNSTPDTWAALDALAHDLAQDLLGDERTLVLAFELSRHAKAIIPRPHDASRSQFGFSGSDRGSRPAGTGRCER